MVDGTTENENENENEEVQYIFTAYEIDLDYEFDAPRFFDFFREESPLEVRQAEAWFDSAGSYPPSPFVARLVWREKTLMKNIKISANCKGTESTNLFESGGGCEADHETSAMGLHDGEPTFYDHLVNNITSEDQTKLSLKPTFPRTSTLMKPTASYLAKQNRPFHAGDSRSNPSVLSKTAKSSTSSSVIENQAAKRQKLEGGLLRKVMDTVQLQQANLVHKAPKRDEFPYEYTSRIKPRISIPKDPNLETARRAKRTMRKRSKVQNVTSTVHRFKALPLNRKILDTQPLPPKRSTPRLPDFQEFYLKTSERAAQHSSLVLKSTVPRNHPAKEINSQAEKRFHTIPPVELFNKLSLASETQPAVNPEIKEP